MKITPYSIQDHVPDLVTREVNTKARLVAQDEGPRTDTSIEALGKLKPVFAQKGSVTAGNSSQMSDGERVLFCCAVSRHSNVTILTPLGKFLGYAVAGVAARRLWASAQRKRFRAPWNLVGLGLHDLDWIELNEAFAAQSLAVINDVGLDPAKVNPLGGAIAARTSIGSDRGDSYCDPAARPASPQTEITVW
ncbi:MAG: hypothetical protein WDM70_05765 [Nitrosomonadales bacterium]